MQLLTFLQASVMPLGLGCLLTSCHLEPGMDTGVPTLTPDSVARSSQETLV